MPRAARVSRGKPRPGAAGPTVVPAGVIKMRVDFQQQKGATGWIFLWLIGIPVPILILLFLARGCT